MSRTAGDRGRVSVFVAAVLPAMLVFIALVWDASGYMRAAHRAENIAAEAARAAGQAIDLPAAVRGEAIVVDPDRAHDAATAYLSDVGTIADGAVIGDVATSDDGRQVDVTVQVEYQPLLLGLWQSGTRSVTGRATAHLVDQ